MVSSQSKIRGGVFEWICWTINNSLHNQGFARFKRTCECSGSIIRCWWATSPQHQGFSHDMQHQSVPLEAMRSACKNGTAVSRRFRRVSPARAIWRAAASCNSSEGRQFRGGVTPSDLGHEIKPLLHAVHGAFCVDAPIKEGESPAFKN